MKISAKFNKINVECIVKYNLYVKLHRKSPVSYNFLKANTMSDFLRTFLNARSLKAVTRELTLEQLNEGYEKLTAIVEERRANEEAVRKGQAERLQKIAEYKEMLRAEGIDLADLIDASTVTEKTSKRAPRPPKYQYTDADGSVKTWTGQGRQPVPIREAIAQGKSLNDFLI
jgi:DNA-binding protein H-NS